MYEFYGGGHAYGCCGVGVGQLVLLRMTMMMKIDRIKVRGMVDGDCDGDE